MKIKFIGYLTASLLIVLCSCSTPNKFRTHIFPTPVSTSDQAISYQEKKTYTIDGLSASNQFDAARMNDFTQVNDSTFRVTILPENEPLNESPHYAFLLKSDEERDIELELYYGDYKHRYYPKLSYDKKTWTAIDSMSFDTLKAGNVATLKLKLDSRPLYVAAEEIRDSEHTKTWMQKLADKYKLKLKTVGKSKLDRDMLFMDIGTGDPKDKPAIVLMSRAHPPEISGYMAMEAFVEEILRDSPLSNNFRKKYRLMLYPLLNPDGVDLGHWRHNAGGIDLNRDWANYKQDEIHTVANHIVSEVGSSKNKVIMGIDFHSTQEDVIYTHTDNVKSAISPFKDLWIQAMEDDAMQLNPNEEAYDLGKPMTKGWFYLQFGAEGIIYEVGDETDREFLKYKAEVAAREMMKLLAFF